MITRNKIAPANEIMTQMLGLHRWNELTPTNQWYVAESSNSLKGYDYSNLYTYIPYRQTYIHNYYVGS